MNPKADSIAKILTGLAEYYNKTLTVSQLAMYVEDLLDLEVSDLVKAVKLYRREPGNTFFPLPGKLRGILKPSDDQEARDCVSRMIQALSMFPDTYGHPSNNQNTAQARSFIGELGWLIVKRLGGWQTLSRADYDDIGPTAQAQWRELASSLLTKSKLGVLDQAPGIGLPNTPEHKLEHIKPSGLIEGDAIQEVFEAKPFRTDLFKPLVKEYREQTEKEKSDRIEFLKRQAEHLLKTS